jgi:hypothetical protein
VYQIRQAGHQLLRESVLLRETYDERRTTSTTLFRATKDRTEQALFLPNGTHCDHARSRHWYGAAGDLDGTRRDQGGVPRGARRVVGARRGNLEMAQPPDGDLADLGQQRARTVKASHRVEKKRLICRAASLSMIPIRAPVVGIPPTASWHLDCSLRVHLFDRFGTEGGFSCARKFSSSPWLSS